MLIYMKILKSSNHLNISHVDGLNVQSTQPVNIFRIEQKLCILERNIDFLNNLDYSPKQPNDK